MIRDFLNAFLQSKPSLLYECVIEATKRTFFRSRGDDYSWIIHGEGLIKPEKVRVAPKDGKRRFTKKRRGSLIAEIEGLSIDMTRT